MSDFDLNEDYPNVPSGVITRVQCIASDILRLCAEVVSAGDGSIVLACAFGVALRKIYEADPDTGLLIKSVLDRGIERDV